jgi:hypothetical protein
MMDRRTFVGGLGGAVALAFGLLAAPLVVEGQPAGNVPRVGVLFASTPAVTPQNIAALRQWLSGLGHVEGKSFVMEIRYAQARPERFPELVRELLSLKVDVIVASTDGAVAAVRQQTQAIPVVMINSIDPVATGFVASLARPGGNVTGFSKCLLGAEREAVGAAEGGRPRALPGGLYLEPAGQGGSYIAMVTALLVVNWESVTGVPGISSGWPWVLPTLVGSPIIAWVTHEVRLGRRPRL